ncbi:methyl-accepting chemotaxis protein [Rubricella aquisinus]|uniref:Methyl-accepting chemotaxis protein n=1 Tax=Rubricella aquisinus TaxID=2028108 RepID=A0A840X2S8_9RHOB|nr:anti-phage ZorAB system protein ZorA [Rubricella aquisinus]MBB5516165.1 methyl-accepting chemotaxis protein [Rubricella aquisinus]
MRSISRFSWFLIFLVAGVWIATSFLEASLEIVSFKVAAEVVNELLSGQSENVSDRTFVFTLAAWIVAVGAGLLVAYLAVYGLIVPFQIDQATRMLKSAKDRKDFTANYDDLHIKLAKHSLLGRAWREFDETLVKPGFGSKPAVIQNTTRPNVFFNAELVRGHSFGLKMMPSIPGYFVGTGLLLTFIGLVLALDTAGTAVTTEDSSEMQAATRKLLEVASFKFSTSIAGLGSSIVLGIVFRSIGIWIETAFARLCEEIETVLLYRSPQAISVEMASDLKEQRDYMKDITQGDFFQRFGQEFEPRLQNAVSGAMAPVISGIQAAVEELSSQSRQGAEDLLGKFTETLHEGAGTEMRELAKTFEGIQTNLSTLQDALGETSRGFGGDMERVSSTLTASLAQATETAEAFNTAARRLERSTAPLLESGTKISEAVDKMEASLRTTTNALETEQQAVASLSEKLAAQMKEQEALWAQYAERFQGIDAELGGALEQLSKATREQGERMHEYAVKVDKGLAEAVDKLRGLLGGLDENTREFGESVEQLAEALRNGRNLTDERLDDPL